MLKLRKNLETTQKLKLEIMFLCRFKSSLFHRIPLIRTFSSLQTTSLIPETLKNMENDLISFSRPSLNERKRRRRSLELLQIPLFHNYLIQQNLSLHRDPVKILQMNITRYCNQACTHCHVESSPKRTEFMSIDIFQSCYKFIEQLSSDTSPSISPSSKSSPSSISPSSTSIFPSSISPSSLSTNNATVTENRQKRGITTVDLTGGAPELHPYFRQFVQQIRTSPHISPDLEIIVRCNLTVLLEPDQEDLADFFAQNRVRVIASLPCYTSKNVNQQRGANVFERSIVALQRLNAVGYGATAEIRQQKGLKLDLVYNPSGAFLPPSQSALETQYKELLHTEHGIVFNSLLTLTNMPIKRFADQLYNAHKLDEYMSLLVNTFNPHTVTSVMCRDTVSVDWNGWLYDCDFNQQLDLRMARNLPTTTHLAETVESTQTVDPLVDTPPLSIHDLVSGRLSQEALRALPISVDSHCYGCTAGSGSSCQGAL
jgi:radical SAM/Cys-rich protein